MGLILAFAIYLIIFGDLLNYKLFKMDLLCIFIITKYFITFWIVCDQPPRNIPPCEDNEDLLKYARIIGLWSDNWLQQHTVLIGDRVIGNMPDAFAPKQTYRLLQICL